MKEKTFDDHFIAYVQSGDWHNSDDRDRAEQKLSDWFEGLSERTKFAIAANYVLFPETPIEDNPWLQTLSEAEQRVMGAFRYDTGGAHVYIEFKKIS